MTSDGPAAQIDVIAQMTCEVDPAGTKAAMDEFGALPAVPGVSHRRVDVAGLSMHVAEAGSGPPLLLVHGWPQHWWCWRRVIPLLTDRYRLIVPDLRGHGWSEAPPSGYDKEQLASDLLQLLDALRLERVGYVGHDWGAWTGFLAALRAPQRFSALLALGIIHPFQRLSPARALQAWRGIYQVALSLPVLPSAALRASPRLVASAIAAATGRAGTFTREELLVYGTRFQEPARARASARLYRTFLLREVPRLNRYLEQRLVVPTRLVVGDRDLLASPALLDGWQDHAIEMSVEVLPGIGHFVPEEAADVVAARADEVFS